MSGLDIIPIPGHPGMWARRAFVQAWQAAGSPPLNSAGRLYADQKYFYDGWRDRLPGFNPADNPDDETQRLAHVRGVAGDIDPTPDRVRRLAAAGLIRPYSYEPWHWELPNVRSYAIVRTIPSAAGGGTRPEEDDMTPEERNWLKQLYMATFKGGPSMQDGEKSISESLAQLPVIWNAVKPITRDGKEIPLRQEVADTKTKLTKLEAEIDALRAQRQENGSNA